MLRRVFSLLFALYFTFAVLCVRIYKISQNVQYAQSVTSLRVKTFDNSRGTVYDRNMKKLTNTGQYTIALLRPTENNYILLKSLKNKKYADSTIGKGYFTSVRLADSQQLRESDNIKLMQVFDRYAENVAVHLIGYTDSSGNGVCGIEKHYNEMLKNSGGQLSVAYSTDALGRMLNAEPIEIRSNNYYNEKGIVLTINKDFQKVSEKAMKNAGITKGAVVILDVNTGEVLTLASSPEYDRSKIEEYLSNNDAPFINRALCSFAVGSVFKPITAAAATENHIPLRKSLCTGQTEKSGLTFYCNKKEGHGELTFNEAMSLSCNPYFIDLGIEAGGEKILKTAKALGFGKEIDLGNGLSSASGTLPTEKELNSNAAIGNLSFGQGKLSATPLQIAAAFSVFANGGIYNKPHILLGYADSDKNFTPVTREKGHQVIEKSTCKRISEALLQTTLTGTGKGAFSHKFSSCTKTGTAQSGQYDENNNEIKISWFAGYFPYENPRYSICILKENGISGGSDGAPVFKEISEFIYDYDKGITDS